MANGMESTGASFGISTNRAQYPALHQQSRSFGKMGFAMPSGTVAGSKPLAGGSQAAGMIRQPGPTMPRSGGMVGDNPVFKPRPPAGGVTGTLPNKGSLPNKGLGMLGSSGARPLSGGNPISRGPRPGGGLANPPMRNPTPTKGPVLGGVMNKGPRMR